MKTESILQSFQYAEKVNILLYYGRETETLQIIQPLSSFHNQARMHPRVTRYKLMKPIEKTIHSPNDGSKTQAALFTLALAMLFPYYYRFTQNWNNLSARMQRWNKNTGCLKYLNSFWWSASLAQTSREALDVWFWLPWDRLVNHHCGTHQTTAVLILSGANGVVR